MIILSGNGRLRALDRHLRAVPGGTPVVAALTDLDDHRERLVEIGFRELAVGETVLPLSVGPVSTFNAEGTFIVHKDQPKETAYRQQDWTWYEFHGRYDRVERSKTVDVPYERYPRTFVPPPSVELTIAEDADGQKVVVTPQVIYDDGHAAELLHSINLVREIFGETAILTESLDTFTTPQVRRLNWEVLPAGEMPWPQLQRRLRPVLDDVGERTGPVITRRLELLTETHEPNFVAVGRAGFNGYMVFGYPSSDVYVLESIYYGNATYVFGDEWERLSQMTKAEILRNDLQEDRIIHREGWDDRINDLLG